MSEPTTQDPAEICTLPPDGMEDRLTWIKREILPHAVETIRLEKGLAFELAEVPGLVEKVDRLVELESDCCSSITWRRTESSKSDQVRLEILGVNPDAQIFRSLKVPESVPEPQIRRFGKAAGFGLLSSFVVCCVLPIAAGALLGTATAPLAGLDGPGPLAAGALLGGSAAWWWLGRRNSRG
ncbi:MAG: hypothetical protein JRH01_22220 [Deltaproteobacteria bacterium]|nr:hypothetical protein [Deltaproteobacteria bacterium]MBW2396867.1 hypothetical protein [Deltaproteobacteria bacterium]